MKIVDVKMQRTEYSAMLMGKKDFIIVPDKLGGIKYADQVNCIEYDGDEPTGRAWKMKIFHVDRESEGLKEGFALVGICGTDKKTWG